MSKKTTDLREQIQNICDKYGYFLGLAYEGEDGSLKTHEKGKVVDELEALISNREKLARIDELREAARHADRMYPECDNVLDHIENRIATLRKELDGEESHE